MLANTLNEALNAIRPRLFPQGEEPLTAQERSDLWAEHVTEARKLNDSWKQSLAVEYASDLSVETQQGIYELVFPKSYTFFSEEYDEYAQEEYFAQLAAFARLASRA
jgi:hypothetical protein